MIHYTDTNERHVHINDLHLFISLPLLRRTCGDDTDVVGLLLAMMGPNSVESDDDTDVDLIVSVVGGIGRARRKQ
jgi:hypothetical protein